MALGVKKRMLLQRRLSDAGLAAGLLALVGVLVLQIAALGGDVAGDVFGIVPHAPNKAGATAR